MRTINNEIMMQYGLNINKMVYSRSNYYLNTDKGQFLLRKVLVPKEQIVFEYEVNKQLIEKGFEDIETIYPTQRNQPYVVHQDKTYVLQSNKQAVDTDFTDKADMKGIIGVLAKFHDAGKHIISSERNSMDASFKNIHDYFSKRARETKNIKKSVITIAQKSPFEVMFLEDYRIYEDLEQRALSLITHEICEKIAEDAKKNQCIAHNEYAYHAVGRSNDQNYFIDNLDKCTYNIQLTDLANVLIKMLQKNNWDIALLNELIEEYIKYHTLEAEEIMVLKAMLIFPEKYASICHKYITSKRRNNYSMFETKWENMREYKNKQLKTVENIEKHL